MSHNSILPVKLPAPDPYAPALPGIIDADAERTFLFASGAITAKGWVADADALEACKATLYSHVLTTNGTGD